MAAIRAASASGVFVASSRTDGLRAVRLFEEMNGVWFDPADFQHRMTVTNTGWFFGLQRRLKRLNEHADDQGESGPKAAPPPRTTASPALVTSESILQPTPMNTRGERE